MIPTVWFGGVISNNFFGFDIFWLLWTVSTCAISDIRIALIYIHMCVYFYADSSLIKCYNIIFFQLTLNCWSFFFRVQCFRKCLYRARELDTSFEFRMVFFLYLFRLANKKKFFVSFYSWLIFHFSGTKIPLCVFVFIFFLFFCF